MNINVPLPSRVVLRIEGRKSDNRLPHVCFACAVKKSLSDEQVDMYLVQPDESHHFGHYCAMCDRYLA